VNHDIRRTVRTRLSELRVPEPVVERVIGHAAKGLARVYDQHRYASEMREALDAWEKRLIALVAPPPGNVVPLRAERPADGLAGSTTALAERPCAPAVPYSRLRRARRGLLAHRAVDHQIP